MQLIPKYIVAFNVFKYQHVSVTTTELSRTDMLQTANSPIKLEEDIR